MSEVFKRLVLTLTIGVTLGYTGPVSANSARETITDQLVDREVQVPFPKIELSKSKWTRVRGRYELGFFPHRDVEKYYRRESLDISLLLGSAMDDHLSVNFGPSVKAEFVRPFYRRDLLRDKKNNPYSNVSLYRPGDAPHSADKALALTPGEYYSFTARLGFQISGKDALGTGIAFIGPSATYAVHGDFKLTVYRMGGSKVKVIASSKNEKRIRLGGRLRTLPDIDVFSVNAINNLAESALEVNLIDWQAINYAKGSLYSVSFDYDLRKAQARRAFEKLMDLNNYKWKELKVLNPLRKHKGPSTKKVLFGKIELSEAALSQDGSGVERDYVSTANYTSQGSSLSFDIIAAKTKFEKNYLEMDYQIKRNNQKNFRHYKVASYTMGRDYRIGRHWRESDIVREGNVIFKMNSLNQITQFEEISFSYYRADVKLKSQSCLLCQDELPYVLGQIRKMLPASWYSEMKLEKRFSHVIGRRTVIDLDVTISPRALDLMQSLTSQEIDQEVDRFANILVNGMDGEYGELYFGQLSLAANLEGQRQRARQASRDEFVFSEADFLAKQLKSTKEGFQDILRRAETPAELLQQWSNFNRLRGKRVFRELFSGLTVRLLQKAARKHNQNLKNLMQARFVLQAEGVSKQEVTLGNFKPDKFNQVIMRDRDRILNRNFNPAYFD